jgi:hypothetical protein
MRVVRRIPMSDGHEHVGNGVLDEDASVLDDDELGPGRKEFLPDPVQFGPDAGGGRHRVRIGTASGWRWTPPTRPGTGPAGSGRRALLHPGHVAEAHDLAVGQEEPEVLELPDSRYSPVTRTDVAWSLSCTRPPGTTRFSARMSSTMSCTERFQASSRSGKTVTWTSRVLPPTTLTSATPATRESRLAHLVVGQVEEPVRSLGAREGHLQMGTASMSNFWMTGRLSIRRKRSANGVHLVLHVDGGQVRIHPELELEDHDGEVVPAERGEAGPGSGCWRPRPRWAR